MPARLAVRRGESKQGPCGKKLAISDECAKHGNRRSDRRPALSDDRTCIRGTGLAQREPEKTPNAQEFLFDSAADFHTVRARAGVELASFQSRLLKLGKIVGMHGMLAPFVPPIAACSYRFAQETAFASGEIA